MAQAPLVENGQRLPQTLQDTLRHVIVRNENFRRRFVALCVRAEDEMRCE